MRLCRFPRRSAIGRALTLFFLGEALLTLICFVSVDRPPLSQRSHVVFAVSAIFAALTPLIANAAQLVPQPVLAIVFSGACAALAQGGLWAIVYLMTGVALDWLGGRPPRFDAVWNHWRTGFIKGAIYGALFIGLHSCRRARPAHPRGPRRRCSRYALVVGPAASAQLLFPLGMTVVGSADGTPPFFGRLDAAYRDPRAPVRGVVAGLGLALAYLGQSRLPSDDGARFLSMFAVGALCLRRRRPRLRRRERRRAASGQNCRAGGSTRWERAARRDRRGRASAGISTQPSSRSSSPSSGPTLTSTTALDGRALGDFVTYPIFNKYGMINLGQVAGGVRLLLGGVGGGRHQLVARGAAVLDQLRPPGRRAAAQSCGRSRISSARTGVEGLVEQAVRVLRWGLWMAPIINSFLRQSPDPSWYNQDGAVRTVVAIGADASQSRGKLPPVQPGAVHSACSPTTGCAF